MYIHRIEKKEIMEIPEEFMGSWQEKYLPKSRKTRLLILVWRRRDNGKNAERRK